MDGEPIRVLASVELKRIDASVEKLTEELSSLMTGVKFLCVCTGVGIVLVSASLLLSTLPRLFRKGPDSGGR
jgi:hypothetical protein